MGDLVRALHRDRGVPFTEAPLPGGTRRAVNLVGPDGRRCSLYDGSRSQEVRELPPHTVRAPVGVSRHVRVSISRPCAASLPLLRDLGVTVSTDLHDRDGVNPYHEPFAHAADLVFLSAAGLADPEKNAPDHRAGPCPDGLRHGRGAGRVPPGRRRAEPHPAGDAADAGRGLQRRRGRLRGGVPLRSAHRRTPAPLRPLRRDRGRAYACTVPSTRTDSISRADLLARAGEPAP